MHDTVPFLVVRFFFSENEIVNALFVIICLRHTFVLVLG